MRPLEGVRILLVEDDDGTREMTRLALQSRGAVIVCARDATEGLAAFATREARVTSREAGFHYHLTTYDVENLTEIVSGLVRLTRA